ncbi:MAG TPA: choice-of-anchor Q domain-containing protein [Pseudobacteroides sp.]|uniref:stalk domain-containing protein n=1 Tax=Pseudobacteroides sp. TaxID=1968840 RepID=UPI002F94470E
MSKKIFLLAAIIYLMSFFQGNVYSSGNEIGLKIDNELIVFNENMGYPFIDSAYRTQVPFRIALEKFGASVSWSNNTASAQKGYIKVDVPIGKPYILKNGVKIPTDTTALVKNGRAYLPIRPVLEALNARVIWNEAEKLIEVVKVKPRPKSDISQEDMTKPDYIVSSESELRNALKSKAKIKLKNNIDVSSTLEVRNPTVIDGAGYIIGGKNKNQIFKVYIADFTLQNITLKDGKNTLKTGHFSDQCGAAVMMTGKKGKESVGEFKAVNVNFINNECASSSNLGDIRGGAVYLFSVPYAYFSNCRFIGNKASNGGAIGGLGSSMKVVNCDFIANKATGNIGGQNGSGGAISLDGLDQNGKTAFFDVIGSNFTGNSGDRLGGAIFYVFHKPGDEGYHKRSTASIVNSTFEFNELLSKEEGQGGAIYAQEGDLKMDSCTFDQNRGLKQGGGLWFLSYTGNLDIINSTFYKNTLSSPNLGMGGAIAVNAVMCKITNSTFADNYAWFHGGGIQAIDSSKVRLTNCILSNNRSERDWAVYNTNMQLSDGGGNIEYVNPSIKAGKKVKDEKATAAVLNKDPKLLPLADYGGFTKTMAIVKGSPAINIGAKGSPVTDQRGVKRIGTADAGAYEFE